MPLCLLSTVTAVHLLKRFALSYLSVDVCLVSDERCVYKTAFTSMVACDVKDSATLHRFPKFVRTRLH